MSKREIKFKLWNSDTKSMSKPVSIDRLQFTDGINSTAEFLQFTGLTDKNGKEIYEGDILQWQCSSGGGIKKGIVHFDEGTLTCWCKDKTLTDLFYTQTNEHYLKTNRFKHDCPEVIGNKFENPELIEVLNV